MPPWLQAILIGLAAPRKLQAAVGQACASQADIFGHQLDAGSHVLLGFGALGDGKRGSVGLAEYAGHRHHHSDADDRGDHQLQK